VEVRATNRPCQTQTKDQVEQSGDHEAKGPHNIQVGGFQGPKPVKVKKKKIKIKRGIPDINLNEDFIGALIQKKPQNTKASKPALVPGQVWSGAPK